MLCKFRPSTFKVTAQLSKLATRATNKRSRLICTRSLSSRSISAVGFNDYEEGYHNFKIDVPEYFNFASDVFDKWAGVGNNDSSGSMPALWWTDDEGSEMKWSFFQLSEASQRFANVLEGTACNLRREDVVIVILPRIPEWWIVNLACIRTGLVLSPGTVLLTANDIKERFVASQAKCIITDETTAEAVSQVLDDCPDDICKIVVTPPGTKNVRPGWLKFDHLMEQSSNWHQCVKTRSDDPLTLFFTSGTTGAPKMAQHTHASYGLGHIITGRYWLDLTSKDVHWNLADTGWAKSAWSSVFAPWVQGACVFVHYSSRFDPEDTLNVLNRYPITTFCTSPTAYRVMIQMNLQDYKCSNLRHIVSAGEPLNPEVTAVWEKHFGLTLREGYGQTETTALCGSFRCIKNKPGSMGKSSPGYDVQIVDETGNTVDPGVEGDISVRVKPHRPVGLFTKYLDDDERTVSSFRGDFYLTGDRGYKDEEGYLWFVGRSDDVILSAGYRIGPFEVESALLEHPAVAESAVVSAPDAIRGSAVKAIVVLNESHEGMDKSQLMLELQNHVKTVTAPYKYPRQIEFVKDLPKTVSGKIRRIELRDKEWNKPTQSN